MGAPVWLMGFRSTAPAGRSAGVALQARAVADQGEVAAFAAAVAFVALHTGFADLLDNGWPPVGRCLRSVVALSTGLRQPGSGAGNAVQRRPAEIPAGGRHAR